MQVLKEQPQIKERAAVVRIAPLRLTQSASKSANEIGGNSEPGTVLTARRLALHKIAAGVARLGRFMSGPPMIERKRLRYAVNAFEIHKYKGISSSWLQFPSR
jgi:hypothetical protein